MKTKWINKPKSMNAMLFPTRYTVESHRLCSCGINSFSFKICIHIHSIHRPTNSEIPCILIDTRNHVLTFISTAQTTMTFNNSTFFLPDNISTEEEFIFPLIKQPIHMIAVFSITYIIIFLCALVGNTMVVLVVARTPRMRNVTNYFIANLAVGDILVAVFCIPITLLGNIYNGWPFGSFMCRATPYLQGVSVCASVNTLAAIAIDRYLAICHSPSWRTTTKNARVTVISIWIFSCLLLLPWAIFYEEYEHVVTQHQVIRMCHQLWPDFESQRGYFMGAIFIGCYVLPLSVVFMCYVFIGLRVWNRHAPGVPKNNRLIRRSKIKVVKMLAVMVLLFMFSWMPLHVIFIKLYYDPPRDQETNHFIWTIAVPISQWLELSNSGINPIIYCFFSKNFRRGFKNILTCFKSKRQRTRGYSSGATKYMTIEYTNGNVTISFRKEGREDSSSTV